MKLIFSDYSEIRHVLDIIKEQWEESPDDTPPRPAYIPPMPTARYLADLLRSELLQCGEASPGDIEDPNEIMYGYLAYTVEPGMWQYHFADCLLSLLLYFHEPIGPAASIEDSWRQSTDLEQLGAKCLPVMLSDHLRHALLEGDAFRVKASELSQHLEAIAPDAERGKKFAPKGRGEGPLKKLVRAEIERLFKAGTPLHKIKPRMVWDICKDSTGAKKRRLDFYESYVWVPDHGETGYDRFGAIVREVKRMLKPLG